MARPRNFEDILSRLPGAKQSGDHWTAPCPLTGHKTPVGHLTLKDAGDKALATCQGGRHDFRVKADYDSLCQILGFTSLTYSDNGSKLVLTATARLNDHEAIAELKRAYSLTDATIQHFGIEPDYQKQAWRYPVKGGTRYKKYSRTPPKKYWHTAGTPNQLYGYGNIREGTQEVYLLNGEPAVWVAYQAGVPAACGIYGEGQLPDNAKELLKAKGVEIITIIPDLDKKEAAQKPYSILKSEFTVKVRELPGHLGERADACDLYAWCKADSEAFKKILGELLDYEPQAEVEASDLEPSITPLVPAPAIDQVCETVMRNFPESEAIWLAADACLSVFGALTLADLSHPLAVNLQDNPSSWKTTVLDFFTVKDVTYHSDHFTPKSFVSHAANVKKEKLAEIDLLPRIRDRVIIIPELAPLFGVRKEDLLDNISILTRLFDGKGLVTDSGAQGRRGYSGEYLFGWLGATTPLPDSVWYMLGKLGSRWLFLSMDSDTLTEKQLVDMIASERSYGEKLYECRLAVSSFITDLLQRSPIRSVRWQRTCDPPELLRVIARLADLVRRLRGVIATWGEGGDHTPPIIEYPPRLAMLLYDLARGHAMVHGRRQLCRDDINLVTHVALSSMPDARRRVFKALLREGMLETKDVMEVLKVTRPTALKVMRTLAALGAVIITEEEKGEITTRVEVSLLPQDQWLIKEDLDITQAQRRKILQPDVLQPNASVKEFDAVYVQDNADNDLPLPPEYPHDPCPACGGTNRWLREASPLGGPAEWLCSRCHPKPGGNHCYREVKRQVKGE